MACSRSNWLAVIDMDTLQVEATVAVGTEPIAVVHDPVRDRIFTTDARTSTLSVVDGATLELIGQVAVGAYCAGAGIHVGRRKVLTGNTADGTVTMVDADSLAVLATVPARFASGSIAVDEARDRTYVVNFGDDTVTVIDTDENRSLTTVPVGAAPCKIDLDPDRGVGYVANSLTSELAVLDLEELVVTDRIPVERAPVGLAACGDRVYAVNRGAGSVSIIGSADHSEWGRIPVGDAPGDVAVDRDGRTLYVSNAGSCDVSVVVDLLDDPAPVPEAPTGGLSDLVGSRLPPWDLYDARTGGRMTSEAWAGHKYILNFFASW